MPSGLLGESFIWQEMPGEFYVRMDWIGSLERRHRVAWRYGIGYFRFAACGHCPNGSTGAFNADDRRLVPFFLDGLGIDRTLAELGPVDVVHDRHPFGA